jgi:uncharacterized protein
VSVIEVLVAIAILVGLVGILLPLLPGTVLVLAAIFVWALDLGTATAWGYFAVAAVVLVLGSVAKYVVPGRRLSTTGIPRSTLFAGIAVGVVGIFVVPVVGLFLGFILGIYLAERYRVGAQAAWPSTREALRAIGVSILIELAAGVLATGVWLAGVSQT